MKMDVGRFIIALAKQCKNLPPPIHLLAMCSGGKAVAKTMQRVLKSEGLNAEYYEVWTDTIHGKRRIWKTDFKKRNYTGTAVIVEDVIWKGRALPSTRKMLNDMKKKKVYVASLLDCNKKADFSVFN
ncbi:hypothetical protein HY415_01400 [Candidatus Kaiserbacteria bacterium]|nr:hypothetical protein [Candidatus Kaiserbacteria bacterium]